MNPLGDWTTQEQDPAALFQKLGPEIVRKRAFDGDREAQWSLGFQLVSAAGGHAGSLGAGGRSPMADVGLALLTHRFRVSPRCGHLTKRLICGCY